MKKGILMILAVLVFLLALPVPVGAETSDCNGVSDLEAVLRAFLLAELLQAEGFMALEGGELYLLLVKAGP